MTTGFRFSYNLQPDDLAPIYCHVRHTTSLVIAQEAFFAYLASVGLPVAKLIEQDLFIVIVRVEADYEREIKGGPVVVEVGAPVFEGLRFRVQHRIFNEEGKLAVEATQHWCIMKGSSKRAVRPPAEFVGAPWGAVD